jgi:hypothetical protein
LEQEAVVELVVVVQGPKGTNGSNSVFSTIHLLVEVEVEVLIQLEQVVQEIQVVQVEDLEIQLAQVEQVILLQQVHLKVNLVLHHLVIWRNWSRWRRCY